MCWPPVCSHHQPQEECIAELHLELAQHMARVGLQSKPGMARPLCKVRDTPTAILPHECGLIHLGPGRQGWPSIQRKTLCLVDWEQEGNIPIPGTGMSCSDARVPHPNIQVLRPSPADLAGTHLPLPALHNLIPLMSSSATPWVIFTCTPSQGNPEAGCWEVGIPYAHWSMPPPPQEPMDEYPPKDLVKKQVIFNLDDDVGDDLHCPQTWPSS